ncbi:MAG: amidohydrolase [Pirellulaceae bacterium]|nr:amidohydrolase [Pirellulaceae bacterium]
MAKFEKNLFERLVQIRRDLHQHPELSYQEYRTADRVCAFLDQLPEVNYRQKVAGAGVVAEIVRGRFAEKASWVALRADLDALPMHEETGLPFASSVPGVMHACGHDVHTTALLGAATLLAEESELAAPIRLLFQPAEETGDGAQAMIEAGALRDVGMIFGGHVDQHYPVGTIVVAEGTVNASSDAFVIHIQGRGGHAARPHQTIDAVMVGSLLVMALQTIVSREINPSHPAVVTVARFEAGTAANVIADTATLQGTVRAQDADVRLRLEAALKRMAASIGQLHGAKVSVEISRGTPMLINQGKALELARNSAIDVVSHDQVLPMESANMGGEDFSYYLEHVSGCYVRYGARGSDQHGYPAHSAKFDVDESVLAVASSYLARVAKTAASYLATANNKGQTKK